MSMQSFFRQFAQVSHYTVSSVVTVVLIAAALVAGATGVTLPNDDESDPLLPVQDWTDLAISWLNDNLAPAFDVIAAVISAVQTPIEFGLSGTPALLLLAVLAALGYVVGRTRLMAFILFSFALILLMGYWEETMITLSLVLTSTAFSLIFGIPLGVAKAHSKRVQVVLEPILDFMQTMPLFVYLIPAVLFFGIGEVSGIVATFIFATPPVVRLTSLGIEQIPTELIEAGKAFGTSPWQFLTKVELPLALPSIMLGVNQTIMLSLSMVVVASMIGVEGLGQEVLRGITRLSVGQGLASGLGIVLLAMVLDRLTRALGAPRR